VGIPVLLVATATKWASPARLPRELAQAGFDVAVLAPEAALVAQSRHVASVNHLPDTATPMHWLYMVAAIVASWTPRLIIPCDDTAVQLMMSYVNEPSSGLGGPQRERLVTLFRESLGDPRHYRTSIDKTLLPPAAEALGVRVPPYAVVADAAAVRAFARVHGYPVVLKRAFGTGGDAVEIIPDEARLEPAFQKLRAATRTAVWNSGDLLVQAWISGKGLLHAVAAWDGIAHAGMTREVLMRYSATGPSTVVRCRHAPEARRFSGLLAAGLGISGFFGPEFIEHDQTGETYLIEINRRVTNGVQLGGFVGVDLCAALAAALSGRANAKRTDLPVGEEHLVAEFPQEWLRDPSSSYLESLRTDIPWDDPPLFRAMLAMRDMQ
jgi:predicted ATP-grasp superfamily ATP-dependent carboligase